MFYFAIKLVLDEKVANVNLIDCIANIRQVFSVKMPLELFNPFLFWFNAIPRDGRYDAIEHLQGFRAWRTSGLPARQDRQPGCIGPGFPPRR